MKNKITSLRSVVEFQQLFKKGKLISNSYFLIKFIPTKEEEMKFGISASKKHFKTAVERNKIKRQIRMIVKGNFEFRKLKFLIILKPSYKINEFDVMSENLISLFRKIKT